jgi:hypothetical protein
MTYSVESGQIEVLKTETDINDVLQYLLQFFKMKQNEREFSSH